MAEYTGTMEECLEHLAHQTLPLFWKYLQEEVIKQTETDAAQVERDAKMLAPVGKKDYSAPTGERKQAGGHHMNQDITHRVVVDDRGVTGMVGVPKDAPSGEYAAFPELGTGRRGAESGVKIPKTYSHPKYKRYNLAWPGMPAQYFMHRALAMNQKRIRAGRHNAIQRAVERTKGGG